MKTQANRSITHHLSSSLVTFSLALSSMNVNAEPLRFSYWPEASAPFVELDDGELTGGIIKGIGDALGLALGHDVGYIKLPTPRIEPFLVSGEVDVDCVTNPKWKASPERYHWSPPLFSSADRFLIRKGVEHEINTFADLHGRTLGIYQNYIYHPEITQMINNGDIATVNLHDLEKGITLLGLDRIDALIDFELTLRHQLKQSTKLSDFTLAKHPADTFELHCAYSKSTHLEHDTMQQAFEDLLTNGGLDGLLKH